MIEGAVSENRQSIVRITLVGGDTGRLELDVVVDTGFTGYLRLNEDIVEALGLEFRNFVVNTLANGQDEQVPTYIGSVDWEGELKPITVQAINEGDHLLGMALLSGCRLTIEAVPGGAVAIEPDMCEPFAVRR